MYLLWKYNISIKRVNYNKNTTKELENKENNFSLLSNLIKQIIPLKDQSRTLKDPPKIINTFL